MPAKIFKFLLELNLDEFLAITKYLSMLYKPAMAFLFSQLAIFHINSKPSKPALVL